MPCRAVPCRAESCGAVPCHAVPCRAVPCRAVPCHVMPCHAMPCHAMPRHAMPCHAMPCHAMPCHAMPCHAMPCHAMPCYVSVVGELLTYHFASMLGLDNVPMTLLRHSDRRSRQRVAARLDDRGPYLMVRQLSPTSSVNIVTQYIPIPQAEWYGIKK